MKKDTFEFSPGESKINSSTAPPLQSINNYAWVSNLETLDAKYTNPPSSPAPGFKKKQHMTAKQRQHQAHKINIANDLKRRLDKYSDLITFKYCETTREQPMKT